MQKQTGSNITILASSSRQIGSFDDITGSQPVNNSGTMIDSNGTGHRKRIAQTIVDLIVIIAIFVIFILVYVLFDPKIRYMTCDQSDIFFPYSEDTIPFWVVGIYGTVAPIIFIVIIEILNARILPCQYNKHHQTGKERWRKFFVCTFHALSLFVLGIALTLCLTEIGKRWVFKVYILKIKKFLN